jgi:hypothetical protein
LSATDVPVVILVVLWAAAVVLFFIAGYSGAVRGVTYLPLASQPLTGIAARIGGVVFLGVATILSIVGVSGTLR